MFEFIKKNAETDILFEYLTFFEVMKKIFLHVLILNKLCSKSIYMFTNYSYYIDFDWL